jgi:hypothetical protein
MAVESNPAAGETCSSFGVAVGAALAIIALWRQQNSSEENIADQERQTARKRTMDLTGSRSSTSSTISSGSDAAEPDTAAIFLLLLTTVPQDGIGGMALFFLLPGIVPIPACGRLGLIWSAVKPTVLAKLHDAFNFMKKNQEKIKKINEEMRLTVYGQRFRSMFTTKTQVHRSRRCA